MLLILLLLPSISNCRAAVTPLSSEEKALVAALEQRVAEIDGEIHEAEDDSAKYDGGLLKALVEVRLAHLRNTRVMLVQKKYSIENRAEGKCLFEGNPVSFQTPSQTRLASLEHELADQKTKLAAARTEDEKYSGGLIKAMTGTQIATLSNTIALLEQRILAEKYGLPYLELGALSQPSPPVSEREVQKKVSPATNPAIQPREAKCEVSIEGFEIGREAGEYERHFAVLSLRVKNNADRRVKAWRLGLSVRDTFGTEQVLVQLTDGQASISPNMTDKASFKFEDNQFIDDEPYDKLVAYAPENLTITIKQCQVSFGE